jgi:uncharacterized protein YcgI (DUF1989 family)
MPSMPIERLNIADTLKVQWNAYLGQGKSAAIRHGPRAHASILEDEAGTHDAFCGASNQATNPAKYGDGRNQRRPSQRTRPLLLGVAKFGLGRKDVHPCLNLFKGVRIEADGTMTHSAPSRPGPSLVLRAEMDLIVVLANCPHVLDPRDPWTRHAAARHRLARSRSPRRRPDPHRDARGPARLPERRRLFPR